MAKKVGGAEALLKGMAAEMAMRLRATWDQHSKSPQPDSPTGTEREAKALIALARASQVLHALEAVEAQAEDSRRERRARQVAANEEMDMDESDPADLERRALELTARLNRIVALLERKQPDLRVWREEGGLDRRPLSGHGGLGDGGEHRAA